MRYDLLDRNFNELLGDRSTLDKLARAVVMSCDCGYEDAILRLQQAAHLSDAGYGTATLRDAVSKLRVPATRFAADVEEMEVADRQLAEMVDRDGEEEVVDDLDRVQLSDGDRRAQLIVDPLEVERAYQARLELTGALGSDEGRERFHTEFRQMVDAGIDPLATFKRGLRLQRAERERLEAGRKVRAREAQVRKRRANERELEKRVEDARAEINRR